MVKPSHVEFNTTLYARAHKAIKEGRITTELLKAEPISIYELGASTQLPLPLIRAEVKRLLERSLIEEVDWETYLIK